MAGYSKRSFINKLGIKAGQTLYLAHAPDNYDTTLGDLPADINQVDRLNGPLDFIQFFTKSRVELETEFPGLKRALALDGMLWISWPKKASKVKTDLDENIVREIGLQNGLVDVKVCAVDEVWSGLKFVYRVKDRG
jgi:hypothetical protein